MASLCALLLCAPAGARPRPSGASLLHEAYLAAGGDSLAGLAGVETYGDLDLAGLKGTFRQVVDLRRGRDATTFSAGVLRQTQVNLTASSWQRDGSGIVTVADTPDAQADAANQSFIDRMGWFGTPLRSSHAVDRRREAGLWYDRIEVAPRGGRPMTLWFGRHDHLLHRIDQLDASHQLNRLVFSDYRRVDGVMIAFSVRQTNGAAAQDTVQIIKTARGLSNLDPAMFRPPASLIADARLLGRGYSSTVPFKLADGRIEVEIAIDGHPPLPFLLDTGASNLVTPQAAKALGLRISGALAVTGSGSEQETGGTATVHTVRLGPVELVDQPFLVATLPNYLEDRGSEPPIAGLVGAELLRRFPTTIDYANRSLSFHHPGSRPRRPANAQALRLLFNQGHPYVTVSVDGCAGVFAIDTGDNSGVTIFHPFFARHDFPVERPGVLKLQGGVGGVTTAMLTRLASIRLGRFHLDRPLVNVSSADRGGFSEAEIGGNLGFQFLRSFNITLDYEHRRAYVSKSVLFGKSADYNRSGLITDLDRNGSLIAQQVSSGSPAARAGLKAGDRIMSMNGIEPSRASHAAFDRMLAGAAGAGVTVVVDRAGQRRAITFMLEELLPVHGPLRPLDRRRVPRPSHRLCLETVMVVPPASLGARCRRRRHRPILESHALRKRVGRSDASQVSGGAA